MKLSVTIYADNPRKTNGMRLYMQYVQAELTTKLQGVKLLEKTGDTYRYQCSDTTVEMSTTTDASGTQITFTLNSLKSDGTPSKAVPIPVLLILMVYLRLFAGRAAIGRRPLISGVVGERVYARNKADALTLYAVLDNLLPPAWVLPYCEGLQASDERFARP